MTVSLDLATKPGEKCGLEARGSKKTSCAQDHMPESVNIEDDSIVIEWKGQMETRVSSRELRLACPCAECVDEWTGAKLLEDTKVPQDVRALHVKNVGRYAIQISWSDGHGFGIYTFKSLHKRFAPKFLLRDAELPTIEA